MDLCCNELTGPIPDELSGLANIETFLLHTTGVSGPVPAWLGDLPKLRELDLYDNELTGPIPAELGDLANLEELELDRNRLTGPIPDELASLTNLRRLNLWDNQLTGQLPTWLGNLTNLQGLDVGGNRLTGTIPTSLGNLTSLDWLSLEYNDLAGRIPGELGRLTNLGGLKLGDNALTGTIPSALGNLASLTELRLGLTVLTGSLPTSLTRLSGLEQLSLEGTGVCIPDNAALQAWLAAIPDYEPSGLTCGESLTPLTVSFEPGDYTATEGGSAYVQVRLSEVAAPARAVTIGVTASPGVGATAADYRVPATVTVWPDDAEGYVGVTALPDTMTDDGETVTLGFGALPGSVTVGAPATVTVTLRDDPTSAETDREALVALYNATGGPSWTDNTNWLTDAPVGEWFGVEANEHGRVTGLRLGGWDDALREHVGNGLTGMLPAALGNVAHLRWLGIEGNSGLTGQIPAELGDLANVEGLDLQANALTGSIPPALGMLPNLERLDLRDNELSGSIPGELASLPAVKWLYLGNNALTGEIPVGSTAETAAA